jgi:hypothetical protein
MSMYVVVLSDIELGLIESLCAGTTLFGTPTGALSIPAALTLLCPKRIKTIVFDEFWYIREENIVWFHSGTLGPAY